MNTKLAYEHSAISEFNEIYKFITRVSRRPTKRYQLKPGHQTRPDPNIGDQNDPVREITGNYGVGFFVLWVTPVQTQGNNFKKSSALCYGYRV